MQSSHAAVLSMLTRVQRFLEANAAALGAIDQSAYSTVLNDAVAALSEHDVSQSISKRAQAANTAKQRVLRNALKLNHMRPIATIAGVQLSQVPEFAALRMPRANSTSRALIAVAGAMSDAASPHAPTFISGGLAPDFLAQLHTAASALELSLSNITNNQTNRSGATAGLAAEATRGRQAVKVLDTLVEPQIAGNIPLLSQWKTAKRVGGKTMPISSVSVDAAAKGPSTTTTTTATTTTPAAA
ncbi:MAG: hypothetical protein ABJE47_25740 [bacterium]